MLYLHEIPHKQGRASAVRNFVAAAAGRGEGECWPWQFRTNRKGYGTINVGTTMGTLYFAHRLSYLLHKGTFDRSLVVRHTCHNPTCVNPGHLLTGTPLDNAQDRDSAGRGWKCPGETNPRAKLSDLDVAAFRGLFQVVGAVFGPNTGSQLLGAKFGIGRAQAYRIAHNQVRVEEQSGWGN